MEPVTALQHMKQFCILLLKNLEPVKLLKERCAVLMVWCSENKACSRISDFLHQLNNTCSAA